MSCVTQLRRGKSREVREDTFDRGLEREGDDGTELDGEFTSRILQIDRSASGMKNGGPCETKGVGIRTKGILGFAM